MPSTKKTARKNATAKKSASKPAASKRANGKAGKQGNGSAADVGPQLFQRWKDGEQLSAIAGSLGWRVGKVRATIAKAAGGREAWKSMRDARRAAVQELKQAAKQPAEKPARTTRAAKKAGGDAPKNGKANGNGKAH